MRLQVWGRLGSAEFIIQTQEKPRRPIRDASGYRSGEIENADVSLEREMSGSRELRADWKESERDGGGGKSLSSAGTGAPVPWTGGAVLANIQPSPCSSTSSTHKQRQVRANQRLILPTVG